MEEELFLSEQHPVSQRWAILEDDGTVAWLYLTEPGTPQPAADCWLYNRIEAPSELSFEPERVPVVPVMWTSRTQGFEPPESGTVRFQWTADGDAVAVWFGQELAGFIVGPGQAGYSRFLRGACPFGLPLDVAVHGRVFGET